MTVYKIWSNAYSRVPEGVLIGRRTEYIDTDKNELFRNSKTARDVKRAYEGFWNISLHEEKVVVTNVKRMKTTKSKGANWGIKMIGVKK